MANEFLPITISLKNRPCLVVGGGAVALRKINTLLDYECDITVIAPEPVEKIGYYASKKSLKLEKRKYDSPEASAYGLVISASDDKELNKQVSEDCKNAGVPVNVVDSPKLCDFIFPAVVRRDCITVAVATDGKAPFLAGHLRLILDDIFTQRWNKIAKLAALFRKKVHRQWKGQPGKKVESLNRFLNADWKSILKNKDDQQIEEELNRLLEG
ncbi:MAG: bifunctional precorrin-2 dehydrogenase/sirohydrochlorin ferrochelatase [candidate division Zixibacteria bacterium]|nr:bifunctional precorrin-2 dehydrogenase/sirohydrochlorin ferrochelatase [candidate division Zixibacteria bacterium]